MQACYISVTAVCDIAQPKPMHVHPDFRRMKPLERLCTVLRQLRPRTAHMLRLLHRPHAHRHRQWRQLVPGQMSNSTRAYHMALYHREAERARHRTLCMRYTVGVCRASASVICAGAGVDLPLCRHWALMPSFAHLNIHVLLHVLVFGGTVHREVFLLSNQAHFPMSDQARACWLGLEVGDG